MCTKCARLGARLPLKSRANVPLSEAPKTKLACFARPKERPFSVAVVSDAMRRLIPLVRTRCTDPTSLDTYARSDRTDGPLRLRSRFLIQLPEQKDPWRQ